MGSPPFLYSLCCFSPLKATPEATPAMKLAKFNFAQTKNHWSNFSTMCKYVQHIIVPYVPGWL